MGVAWGRTAAMAPPQTAPPIEPVIRSKVAFKAAPTLACMTISAVSTAQRLWGRCRTWLSP